MFLYTIAFIILVGLSAFFSAAETAIMSVNRVRIRELANDGDKKAIAVDRLINNHTRLLITILIGNNLVNISASSIATFFATELYGSRGVGIATGLVTFIVLFFGEITPKALVRRHAVKFSKMVAPVLSWIQRLLSPIIFVFVKIIEFFIRDGDISRSFLSEEEIRRFVNVSEEEGVIKSSEQKMINSIFEFDDTTVKEVMIPRIDMKCIEENADFTELIKLAIESGHSRIPVFKETIDRITGIVYVKDLLELLLEKNSAEAKIKDYIRPAYFIPESKKINHLLAEMKKKKVHIAIILDEYGGTAGLVTIEDLLEEIVGDIQDEYDLEPKQIEYINDHEILLDARISIDELNEILPEPVLEEENYETISGFILYQLGYLPK
ncbi:MAG: HlyC/CorC family transporter, partial [Halanaerobiaceae bacterium]|nr:HlyC/CorC family transporter [Halanaerobiaceae bacterium]